MNDDVVLIQDLEPGMFCVVPHVGDCFIVSVNVFDEYPNKSPKGYRVGPPARCVALSFVHKGCIKHATFVDVQRFEVQVKLFR